MVLPSCVIKHLQAKNKNKTQAQRATLHYIISLKRIANYASILLLRHSDSDVVSMEVQVTY